MLRFKKLIMIYSERMSAIFVSTNQMPSDAKIQILSYCEALIILLTDFFSVHFTDSVTIIPLNTQAI